MPRTRNSLPTPTRHKGQRSLDDPLYLYRPYLIPWTNPSYITSQMWRNVVESQQICLLCRETLIGNLLSLDWKIEPRDSTQRDELKSQIEYYTKFFEYTGDYDYSQIIEWVCTDLLDLPFGSGVELGREGDSKEGKVLWLELLDGGTLYPTPSRDWPVAEYIPEVSVNPVVFPKHAINRVYLSPRTEIRRRGWGMAPPQKIWVALNLLSKGDMYYAQLLSDTPSAGILDLINMTKESAYAWVEGWRKLLNGVDPQKIPVLYEHDQAAEWIQFSRNPNDIQYGDAIQRYTAIVTAGYGMAISDIITSAGQNGGNTMAGTLREERRTKRNGYARLKIKMREFFNRMLPPGLQFKFIDMDDELMVSLGRARLANATAWNTLVSGNIFTEEEARAQTVADGMLTISVPEKLPQELQERIDKKGEMFNQPFGNNKPGFGKNGPAERPSMLGKPVKPSLGGKGEAASNKSEAVQNFISSVIGSEDKHFQRLIFKAFPSVLLDASVVDEYDFDWIARHDASLWSGFVDETLPELSRIVVSTVRDDLVATIRSENWWRANIDDVIADLSKYTDLWLEADRRTKELRSYVEGIPLPELSVDKSQAETEIKTQVSSMVDAIPEIIANSVISASRNYILTQHPDDVLSSVYDPVLLEQVRSVLSIALNTLTDVLISNTSGIIIADFGKESK